MEFLFNAADFTGAASDSAQIQAAVDAAAEAGGIAVVPKRNPRTGLDRWEIGETILLPDSVVLKLVGAHLRFRDDFVGNMFRNRNADTPLGRTLAGTQHDVTILGMNGAVLDGGRYNGIIERGMSYPGAPSSIGNVMLLLHNVRRFRLEGLTIRDSRFYSCMMTYCEDVTIRDMTVESHCNVPNQDGFDVFTGCHNVLIENVRGCAGDDMVAITNLNWKTIRHLTVEGACKDIRDVIVRNLQVYSANGCALVRILNHDGLRIYRVLIDGVQETSPWGEGDAATAPNPDLAGELDEHGRFFMRVPQVLGEHGYRTDAAVRIGEKFWYTDRPAEPGELWGVTVRNVSVHAQAALAISGTLSDASFENVRLHGNGFRAVLFNGGLMRNLIFRDLLWESNCLPHPEDGRIDVDWNDTHTAGLSAVWLGGCRFENVRFDGMRVGRGLESVFGGDFTGELRAENVCPLSADTTLTADGQEKPEPEKRFRLTK